ncbi:MAG: cell division protein FtsQ, partial [Treponema sp.]|nr:cell division protein FtsQ [Treponema sp.]
NVDGHTVSVQIDENGVLFPSVGDVASDGSIPLITGLPFEYVQNGMRLPAKYRVFMEQIAKIKKLPQKYFAAISEIHVIPKDYGNYELILYPVHSKIRVLTDRTLDESALQYMMVMLDVVNSIEPNAVEIDLRYGSISYRTK